MDDPRIHQITARQLAHSQVGPPVRLHEARIAGQDVVLAEIVDHAEAGAVALDLVHEGLADGRDLLGVEKTFDLDDAVPVCTAHDARWV